MTMTRLPGSEAVWPEGGGFHSADGLFFTRKDDGGVLIRKYDDGPATEGQEPTFSLDLPPEQWSTWAQFVRLWYRRCG